MSNTGKYLLVFFTGLAIGIVVTYSVYERKSDISEMRKQKDSNKVEVKSPIARSDTKEKHEQYTEIASAYKSTVEETKTDPTFTTLTTEPEEASQSANNDIFKINEETFRKAEHGDYEIVTYSYYLDNVMVREIMYVGDKGKEEIVEDIPAVVGDEIAEYLEDYIPEEAIYLQDDRHKKYVVIECQEFPFAASGSTYLDPFNDDPLPQSCDYISEEEDE